MITFIHASDLHLDAPFHDLSGEKAAIRRREQRDLPRRIAELARGQDAQLVFLCGDLFDGREIYRETGEALVTALGGTGCPVFITPGNHDPMTSESPYQRLAWPKNVHIFRSEKVESIPLPELGCVVHGAAFTTWDREDDPLAGFTAPQDGQIHLMALHGDVRGRRYGPISPSSIAASNLDYLALGHVHRCSGLKREGKTFWAYPGCPEGRGFDECGEKGVLLGRVEKGKVDLDLIQLCARRYEELTVTLEGKQSPKEAALIALKGRKESICRLTFTGEAAISPDLPALSRELEGCCFFLSLRDRTTIARDLWARVGEDSLTGLFLRELRGRMDEVQEDEDHTVLDLAARFGLAALERGEDCRP